ncbi:MAG TPA: hypothetical protein VGI80_07280 [Pyrinomonadaceae bacterium]
MRASISVTQQLLPKALLPSIVIFAAAYCTCAQRTTPVSKGEWGGTGIAMSVTDMGASIQFDCADGSIAGQLRVKKDGSFTVEGTLTRNGPGPIRSDSQVVGRAVVYKGKVDRKSMSLTIADTKTDEKLGEYTLGLNQAAVVRRCY